MYKVYQIKEGDTLESIANSLNTEVSLLQELNNFPNTYQPRLGEQIVVPATTTSITEYTILKGDNLYEIAKRYNVDLNQLLLMNGLKQGEYIYPGDKLMIPNKNTVTYLVKEGDTLESIAKDANKNIMDLIENNQNIYLLPEQLLILGNNR